MGVCGSQLARERNEFHSKQLQHKDDAISDLKEKTKALEDEKQKISEEKETLERNEIKLGMELKIKKEELEKLQNENDALKTELMKSPTFAESVGNIILKTGEYAGQYLGFKK